MDAKGIPEATLYINHPKVCSSCVENLPRMLPPGAKLKVIEGDGTDKSLVGIEP